MRGASRTSFADLDDQLAAENITSATVATRLGDELFAVVGLLDTEHGLRRALSDPGKLAAEKGAVASALGAADAGIATYTKILDRVRCLASAVRVPFIADGDTGYGGLLNVDCTVRGYAAASASNSVDFPLPFSPTMNETPGGISRPRSAINWATAGRVNGQLPAWYPAVGRQSTRSNCRGSGDAMPREYKGKDPGVYLTAVRDIQSAFPKAA